MPTAASYLRGNDYNTLKFSPFELPVNDIAKTIMAKTQYWNEGASKIKARYDDALGLSLTNIDNQQIKKDYISKSEEMLKSLSSQNLGNPDVQQAGIGIFKNLFQDEGILYDDQYTKHLGKVQNDYYTQLKKDPSKASSLNLAYAMEDAQAFQNDGDRMSAKKYYQRRRDYTPYYDPSQDIDRAMKNCKASTNTEQGLGAGNSLNGSGYMEKTTSSSLSSAQVSQCFNAGLSEQAKNQLNINGYMSFRNNKEGLAGAYSNYLHNDAQSMIDKRTKIAAQIATLTKKKNQGVISSEESQALDQYQAADKSYSGQIDNITDTVNRLAKRDFSPLDKDYAGISGLVYSNMKISQFGQAFSHEDFSKMMMADPVQMLHQKQAFDAAQQQDDHNFQAGESTKKINADFILEQLKQVGKTGKNGNLKNADGTIDVIGEHSAPNLTIGEDVKPSIKGYEDFQKDVEGVKSSISTNNEEIYGRLQRDTEFQQFLGTLHDARNPMTGGTQVSNLSPNDLVKSDAFKAYLKSAMEHPELHPDLLKWRKQDMDLKLSQSILDQRSTHLENQIDVSLKDKSLINKIPSIKLENGTVLSALDIQDALEGKNPNMIPNKNDENSPTVDANGLGYNIKGQSNKRLLNVNLKSFKDIEAIQKLAEQVSKANIDNTEKLNARRMELYNNSSYNIDHYNNVEDQKNDAVVSLKDKFSSLPSKEGQGKISINRYNPATGDVIVTIPNLTTDKDGLDIVRKLGIGSDVEPVGSKYPNMFKITNVAGFNEAQKLDLNPTAIKNATALRLAADNYLADDRIKPGQTAFSLNIDVKKGDLGIDPWSVEAVKIGKGSSAHMEYHLLDSKGRRFATENDPNIIMAKASDLNY